MTKKVGIKPSRRFSKEFKNAIVLEFEKGNFSVIELCRLHDLHPPNVYNWIYKYSSQKKPASVIVEMKESSTKKLKDYELKIKELERIIGQKQIAIDYLEKLINEASSHYGEDIKKNSSSAP